MLTDHMAALMREKPVPEELQSGFMAFCKSYEKAVAKPPLAVFTAFWNAVVKQLSSPYQFTPYHEGIKEYYTLGLDFIRPLIDFSRSKVLGKEALDKINRAIVAKENVILLANHQTEIDPQIISLLIEKEYPELASEMIFVAGHRVTTDPLAVPLSLGRHLICIFSKRHIDSPPEKKAEKIQHNQRAMKGLEELLSEGGKCVYIAPSGGRDRQTAAGEIEVAPFDPQAVELFYLISQKAKRPTHFHSLALFTYDLLPPPDQIVKEIGEERKTSFSPAYLAFSDEIMMEEVVDDSAIDKRERRQLRAEAIWNDLIANYKKFYV